MANAVYEQTDAIMLSGETSIGQYPVKTIEIMDRIARRTEKSGGAGYSVEAKMDSKGAKLVKAASLMAAEISAKALIVFTRSGRMARNAAWLRPLHSPIYAFTDNETLLNQLTLNWGVESFLLSFSERPIENVEKATALLKERGLVKSGDHVVSVTETTFKDKVIDTIHVEEAS